MIEFLTSLPFVDLFLKFMVASTVLLGSVWVMEKTRLINTPDLADLAWKLAIAASFVAMLPISLHTKTINIENEKATTFVSKLNESVTPERRISPVATALPIFKKAEQQKPETLQSTAVTEPKASLTHETNTLKATLNAPTNNKPEFDSGGEKGALSMALLESLRAIDMVALFWVGLAALALTALGLSYLVAVKGLGTRKRVGGEHEANRTLRGICEKAGIRHVPYLSRSSDIKSPICLPRREICLPDWAFESIEKSELESLLAHEVGHMVRRDPLMLIVLQFIARLFFFQPLFGLAKKRLTDIAELAADEWAAKQLSNSRAVASALYACASKIHAKRQTTWGMAMAGRESILKARVERLIKAETTPFKSAGAGSKLLLTTALVALGVGLPSIQFTNAAAVDGEQSTDKQHIVAKVNNKGTSDPNLQPLEGHVVVTSPTPPNPNALKTLKGTDFDVRTEFDVAPELDHDVNIAIAGTDGHVLLSNMAPMPSVPDVPTVEPAPEVEAHRVMPGYNMTSSYSDDDRRITIGFKGTFHLNDSETDFIAIEDNGAMKLEIEHDGEERSFRMNVHDSVVTRFFYINGKDTTNTAENEKWLKEAINELILSGFAADERALRILDKGKPADVIKEAEKMDTDWSKQSYLVALMNFKELGKKDLKTVTDMALDFESPYATLQVLQQVFEQKNADDKLGTALKASEKMDSDFDKRQLMMVAIHSGGLTDKNIDALLKVVKSMDSDFEKRQLLMAAVHEAELNDKSMKKIIEIADADIDSDFERRNLYVLIAHRYSDNKDVTKTLLEAVDDLDSDFEKRTALAMVVANAPKDEKVMLAAIAVADNIDSDFEKASALRHIKHTAPESKPIATALAKAGYTEAAANAPAHKEHYSWDYEAIEEYMEEMSEQLERSLEDVERQLERLDQSFDQKALRVQLEAARDAIQGEVQRLREDGIEKGLMTAQKSIEKQLAILDKQLAELEESSVKNAITEARNALSAELEELKKTRELRAQESKKKSTE